MTAPKAQGSCLCGEVRFTAAGAPLITMACHCTCCQRMTGSAYSLSSLYPSDAFEVTAGEPVLGGLRGAHRQYFCPACKSWLFTRPHGLDAYVNVRPTLLDDAPSYRPFIEVFASEALPWARTGAPRSYERNPEEADFPALLAAFAERGSGAT